MASAMYKVDDAADLSEMTMEPHGARNVVMEHCDFRRRFLNKYGQCTKYVVDMVAVETTCKAVAKSLDDENNDNTIAVVYGLNTIKFDSVRDLTVDKVNNCYMDAALDATKRLSTCVDIYYKNKDASTYHSDIAGDGESPGGNSAILQVRFAQDNDFEYGVENLMSNISIVGNVTGSLNITLTPKFCSLKNFKSNPIQIVNANTVYELPVHTLAEINSELVNLICIPEAVGTVYLEVRANGTLVKTLSLNVRDASYISFIVPSETIGNLTTGVEFNETRFHFEGDLQKPASVVVTPFNCTVSGFASDPAMKLLSNGSYRFVANTIETINQELANLVVVPQSAGNCKVTVECLDMVAELDNDVVDPEIIPDAEIIVGVNSSVAPSVILGVKTAIPPIVAAGVINNTIKVKVQPVGCTVSGFASDPDAQYTSNSEYVFYASDVEAFNNELSKLTALGVSNNGASIKITYGPNEDVQVINFEISHEARNIIVPIVDTSDSLIVDSEVGLKPIVFRGVMEKDEATIKITPVNCRFRGVYNNPGEVYTNDRPYTFVGHSLDEFNQEFNHLYVTALREDELSFLIEIVEEHSTSIYNFYVTSTNPENGNISSMITVTSAHLDDRLIVNHKSDPFDLIFTGLNGMQNIDINITPRNCILEGLKSTDTVMNSGDTHHYIAPDSAALINEFDDIRITPTSVTGVKLEINLSELTYILEFTNVSAE